MTLFGNVDDLDFSNPYVSPIGFTGEGVPVTTNNTASTWLQDLLKSLPNYAMTAYNIYEAQDGSGDRIVVNPDGTITRTQGGQTVVQSAPAGNSTLMLVGLGLLAVLVAVFVARKGK